VNNRAARQIALNKSFLLSVNSETVINREATIRYQLKYQVHKLNMVEQGERKNDSTRIIHSSKYQTSEGEHPSFV